MSDGQILPLGRSIGLAADTSAQNRMQRTGRCYPCSVVSVDGAMITVKFEIKADPFTLPQVQMPLFGPEYIRYPIQPGDKGMAVAADIYLGQMSGLGPDGQTADLSEQPNLSTLVFLPIGNKGWDTVDTDAVTIYGPNGVVVRDKDKTCTITLTPGGVVIDLGAHPLTITANNIVLDSSGNLAVTGAIVAGVGGADQVGLQTHRHGIAGTPLAAQTIPPTPNT